MTEKARHAAGACIAPAIGSGAKGSRVKHSYVGSLRSVWTT